jgi:DNA-binding LacI/PurR family transcriptional regulator
MRISKHRVTAAEVAKRAGVSQPTVSLILSRNPKARVAAETRQRVLRIAEEIGYRPNRLAQGLVRRRSFALGVIVPGFDNPFYVSVLSGAERVAAEAGYAVLLCEAGQVDVVQHLEALRDRQIDGVIIAGIAVNTLPARALDDLNVVLINQPSDRYPTVGGDSMKAGALAAEHLLSHGHRRVAFIGPANSIPAYRFRERGFVQRLRAAGVGMPSDLLCRADATIAGGFAAMRALLSMSDHPTAVFCANDLIALGAHKACSAAGVQLPRYVSLLGCDDIEMGTLVTPELSTIAVPQRELGARAVRLLLRQIDHEGALPPASQLLPVRLVVRGTTGPVTKRAGGTR